MEPEVPKKNLTAKGNKAGKQRYEDQSIDIDEQVHKVTQ
jgi:hypothetical protein